MFRKTDFGFFYFELVQTLHSGWTGGLYQIFLLSVGKVRTYSNSTHTFFKL